MKKTNVRKIKRFYLNKEQAFIVKNVERTMDGYDELPIASLEYVWKHHIHKIQRNGIDHWVVDEITHNKNVLTWIENNLDVFTEEKEIEWINL